MKNTWMQRREMLAAAAGAGIATYLAPFARRHAGRAHAAGPKRFILFWHANGAPKAGDFAFTGPAANAKGGVTILRVNHPGTGDHKVGMPFSTTANTDNPSKSISIDQAIAKQTGKPALVLTGKAKPQNYRGWCSFGVGGSTVLPIESPRAAFASVFGVDPGGGGPPIMTSGPTTPGTTPTPSPPKPGLSPAAADHGLDVETAILERAMADVRDVHKRLSPGEAVKMDEQLSALTTIAKNLAPVQPVPGTKVQALVAGDCADKNNLGVAFKEPSNGFDFQTRIKLHTELIVASFLCDLRRVATLMMTPGGHDSMEFSFLGVSGADPHNTIAHKIYDDPANVEKMRKIKVWEMEQLAYLMKRLGETPDPGGGTLLDTTVILGVTECKDGNHGTGPIPVILAGAGKGVGGSKYSEILVNAARASGADLGSFGSGA